MIIAGADNRPPMLEKSMYDSWKSRMELYIENMKNGRMILNSVQNGPLVWPTIVQEDGTTRTKIYEELSVTKKLQADCDLKATNIVLQAFVNHYAAFLGQQGVTSNLNTHNLFTKKLDSNVAFEMIKTVTNQEVKDAIFSMGNDKSPGPDGYTTAFFKEAWDVVANDVTKAVQEFFTNGKLLKELNHTVIALIHKVPSPSRINDYRPISCCNVLFKCISEIISNHIKESLTYLVSPNQYAVVPGRRISDNILLTQELMHNYHLDRGPPRCAFKVDIQKAYDTV
ncbi:putative RNA-directed DNA polymerase, eukaryota, reverse transcriptase zinc-binding domain protein, partial [Tanacetum coccineum]